MEKTKSKSFFKIFMTILLSAAVLAAMVYVIIKGDLIVTISGKSLLRVISFAIMCVCFLLSLFFIGKCKKKIYITLALAVNIAAYYFWVCDLTAGGKNNRLIAIGLFLGVQLFMLLYSLSLTRAIFLKIIDIAIRAALCLLLWFVVKKYVTLSTEQVLGLMYIANSLVTLVAALVHIKTEWLTFIGLLLTTVAAAFTFLLYGGAVSFKLSSAFVEFLLNNYKYVVFATYAVGTLLISVSSVYAKRKSLLKD